MFPTVPPASLPVVFRVVRFSLPAAALLVVAACLVCVPASAVAAPYAPQAAAATQTHKPHRRVRTHRANPAPAERVTYTGGQLSVASSGADLAVVLGAIEQATGVKISGMAAAQKQKLEGEFGPGDPASVLAEVLDGKRLNYIILKSQAHPEVIRSVMLFAQSAPPAQAPTQSPTQTQTQSPSAAAPAASTPPHAGPESQPRNPGNEQASPENQSEPPDEQPQPEAAPSPAQPPTAPPTDDQPRASHS